MQLTDEDIREFTTLWEQEFHERLSPGEARHAATALLELYDLIAQPVSSSAEASDLPPPDSSL